MIRGKLKPENMLNRTAVKVRFIIPVPSNHILPKDTQDKDNHYVKLFDTNCEDRCDPLLVW